MWCITRRDRGEVTLMRNVLGFGFTHRIWRVNFITPFIHTKITNEGIDGSSIEFVPF